MAENDASDLEDDVMDDDADEVLPAPKPTRRVEPEGPGFLTRAWSWQHAIDRKWAGLGRGRIARVLRMARKPEPEEFRQSAVIVLVGIAVIGGIGFFMYLFMSSLIHWIDTNVKGV